jgi:hypothetical protein
MSALADSIDFFASFFQARSSVGNGHRIEATIGLVYLAFSFVWFTLLGLYVDTDFSSTLTAGALLQLMGLVMLNVQVRFAKSVEGLSSKAFELMAFQLVFRLASTSIKNGYIPIDRSGDFAYQFLDWCSLVCVMHLLYRMHKTYASTYEREHDTYPIQSVVIHCIVVACFIHGDFNRSPVFDAIWAASLNLETVAMLPQMALRQHSKSEISNPTTHFLACYVLAAVCRFEFWWYASGENETIVPAIYIVAAHVAQLTNCGRLLFEYTRSSINLPSEEAEVVTEKEMPCSWR